MNDFFSYLSELVNRRATPESDMLSGGQVDNFQENFLREMAQEKRRQEDEELNAAIAEVAPTLDPNYWHGVGDDIEGSYVQPGSLKPGFSRSNRSIGEMAMERDRERSVREQKKLSDIASGKDDKIAALRESGAFDDKTLKIIEALGGPEQLQQIQGIEDSLFNRKVSKVGFDKNKQLLQAFLTQDNKSMDLRGKPSGLDAINPWRWIESAVGESTGLFGVDESNLIPELRQKLIEIGIEPDFVHKLIEALDSKNTTMVDDDIIKDL